LQIYTASLVKTGNLDKKKQVTGKMVLPAFAFLPLYLYPTNTSWLPLIASIAANPSLPFQIVVAPSLANTYPDINYVAGLQSLNAFPNVQTLGYVYTDWALRNVSAVEADIDSYAAWADWTEAKNIGVSGIFFDQAPSQLTASTEAYMTSITTYARTKLGAGNDHITFNPGLPVPRKFYSLADDIVIFENAWSSFNLTVLDELDWDLLAQSIYVIHSFTGVDGVQADLVSNLTDSNVGGVLVTTDAGYTSISGLWAEFCKELGELNDGDGDVRPVEWWEEDCSGEYC
jgi:hypothetical protein